jgi:hypothetical protein
MTLELTRKNSELEAARQENAGAAKILSETAVATNWMRSYVAAHIILAKSALQPRARGGGLDNRAIVLLDTIQQVVDDWSIAVRSTERPVDTPFSGDLTAGGTPLASVGATSGAGGSVTARPSIATGLSATPAKNPV